jgi:hypothetical protein
LTLTGVLSQSFSSISPVSSRCFSSMTFRLSDFVPLNDYNDPAPNRESLREFMKIQFTARDKPKGFAPSTKTKVQSKKSKKKSKS